MRRGIAALLATGMLLSYSIDVVVANPKPGSRCSKAGQSYGKLTCVREAKALRWRTVKSQTSGTVSNAAVQPGLVRSYFEGYHQDDPAWFATRSPKRTVKGVSTVSADGEFEDYFSIRWTGYFIPTETGPWTFTTISDDGSQLWLGRSAIPSVPTEPALLSAPGIHGAVKISRVVMLQKGSIYPVRIHFGDYTSAAEMSLQVVGPNSFLTRTDLSGLVWHSRKSNETHSGIDPRFFADQVRTPLADANMSSLESALSQEQLFSSVERCQLRGLPYRGFPRISARISPFGEVKGKLLFVEFADVPFRDDMEREVQRYVPDFERFFAAQSYGKLNLKLSVHPTVIKIPRNSTAYGMTTHNGGDVWRYLLDALAAADPQVDFGPYELVIVIPPRDTKAITWAPAFPIAEGDTILATQERFIMNATVGDGKGDWKWLAHEVGHLFGFVHPWTIENVNYTTEQKAVWDLMDIGKEAVSLLAWNRFLVGWLGSENVRCIDRDDSLGQSYRVRIAPIESSTNAVKAVIVRLSDKEALVVEVRRNLGFDKLSEFDEGVLVYRVNTQDTDGVQLAKVITTTAVPRDEVTVGTLRPGETVVYKGVQVKVLASASQADYVEVAVLTS